MGDFGRLGSVSLWKSGPFFSTGTSDAELMVKGASVEPAVACHAMPGRLSGRNAGKGWNGVGPKLSTAFPEQRGQSSPGAGILTDKA